MKDLTHYFHSPDKIIISTPELQDDCVVIAEKSRAPDTETVESVELSASPNLIKNEDKLTSTIANNELLSPNKKTRDKESLLKSNCHETPKTGKRQVVNGSICEESEAVNGVPAVNSGSQSKKEGAQNVFTCESNSEAGNEKNICSMDRSPNAFQILMSTQQVFSSSNCGMKENSDDIQENMTEKHNGKKKIKENLERMVKRKLEMETETSVNVSENICEKRSKKRRRIIKESDSEDENEPAKEPISNPLSNECTLEPPGKRKKPALQIKVKKKFKKNNALQTDSNDSALCDDHLTSQKLGSEGKLSKYEVTDVKKTKEVILEVTLNKAAGAGNDGSDFVREDVDTKRDPEMKVLLPDAECNEIESSQTTSLKESNSEPSKRKSNIMNYFSKVCYEVKRQHSEKIEVTADVHFPLTSAGKVPKSKKNVVKRKSKQKGECVVEDDIQVIDTEMTEKPAPASSKKGNLSSTAAVKKTSDVTSVVRTPIENYAELFTRKRESTCTRTPSSSCKEWKMRIRIPESSCEDSPFPKKRFKGHDSRFMQKKFKFSSGDQLNETAMFISGSTPNKTSSKNVKKCSTLHNVSSETEKYALRKGLNLKKRSRLRKVSVSQKKDCAITDNTCSEDENEDTVKNKISGVRKRSAPSRKRSLTGKELTALTNDDVLMENTTSVMKKSSLSKKKHDSMKNVSIFPSKTAVDKKEHSSREREANVGELSTPEKRTVTSRRKRNVSAMKECSALKKSDMKKIPAEKSTLKNDPVTAKRAPTKKIRSSVKAKKTSSNSLMKEESTSDEDFSAISRDSPIKTILSIENISSMEKETFSSAKMCTRAKRLCTLVKKASERTEKETSCSRLRRSSSRKLVSTISVLGISDDEDEIFDDEFDDDIFATDDDDDYIGDDDDSDEPIIDVVKTKRFVSAKKAGLDQKIVLQFLKNARGTLSRKLSGNNISKISSKNSDDAEKIKAQPKLAPVFAHRKAKRPDKATVAARKTFLQSGVPEVVKKMVEIQKLAEEQELIIFPTVSHVQQKEDCVSAWNLPDVEMKFSHDTEGLPLRAHLMMPIGVFTKYEVENSSRSAYSASRVPKIKKFREYLRAIKAESPDFPVYRTFRHLLGQSHPQQPEASKSGSSKKGKRRSSLANEKKQGDSAQNSETACAAWTAKYQPSSSNDILGNVNSVSCFKKWLELWVQVKENTLQKNFKEDMSSGDEFINDASDDDTGKAVLPKNTAILLGPTGSGKTMTVYTLARELGYKVLEVNATAKRTGRRILSELMEATQSHQVNGKADEAIPGIRSFFCSKRKSEKVKSSKKKQSEHQNSNLSLILVEDADIVFEEQDEGFVSALSTLVAGSKRPVVLVTSDSSCPHLSRFLEKSLVLEFKPAPCKLIGVWLQLMCLVEGVRVHRNCVEELLRHNRGDIRKTVLQLQFYVLSGGDNHTAISEHSDVSSDPPDFPDDVSNSSWLSIDDKKSENEVSYPFHSNCLAPFLIVDQQLLPVDRGKIWWNVTHLIGTHQMAHEEKQNNFCETELSDKLSCVNSVVSDANEAVGAIDAGIPAEKVSEDVKKWKSVCMAEDLAVAVKLADALSVVESISRISDHVVGEPDLCAWENDPVDSMSLSADMRTCTYGVDNLAQTIGSWLVSSGIKQCAAQLCPEMHLPQASVLQRQPLKQDLSWREEQHEVCREFESAVTMQCWAQRRAVAMDYLSCLRNICRLEQDRVCVNEKRNNRFFHYLKGVGIHSSSSVLDTACNMFKFETNS